MSFCATSFCVYNLKNVIRPDLSILIGYFVVNQLFLYFIFSLFSWWKIVIHCGRINHIFYVLRRKSLIWSSLLDMMIKDFLIHLVFEDVTVLYHSKNFWKNAPFGCLDHSSVFSNECYKIPFQNESFPVGLRSTTHHIPLILHHLTPTYGEF